MKTETNNNSPAAHGEQFAQEDDRAKRKMDINNEADAKAFVMSTQDWVAPQDARMSGLWHRLDQVLKRRKRWISIRNCELWQVFAAVFGLNFRHTKCGMVWSGGSLGVASNRELNQCHDRIGRNWAERERVHKECERLQDGIDQMYQKVYDLGAYEEQLRDVEQGLWHAAVDALKAASPSFRAAVEFRQKQEERQVDAALEDEPLPLLQPQAGEIMPLEDVPPPPRRTIGSAIRQKIERLREAGLL